MTRSRRRWLILGAALALVLIAVLLRMLPRPDAAPPPPVLANVDVDPVPAPASAGVAVAAKLPARVLPTPEAPPATPLAARMEVEKRIKQSEVKRAELLENGTRHGKHVMAFAIKQPSAAEIREIFAPLEALKQAAADRAEQATIDRHIDGLSALYGLTDGSWRALVLVIPEDSSLAAYGKSVSASSKADCAAFVDELVVPKERVIGVPYQARAGSFFNFETLDDDWRFSELVDRDDMKAMLAGRKGQPAQGEK